MVWAVQCQIGISVSLFLLAAAMGTQELGKPREATFGRDEDNKEGRRADTSTKNPIQAHNPTTIGDPKADPWGDSKMRGMTHWAGQLELLACEWDSGPNNWYISAPARTSVYKLWVLVFFSSGAGPII